VKTRNIDFRAGRKEGFLNGFGNRQLSAEDPEVQRGPPCSSIRGSSGGNCENYL